MFIPNSKGLLSRVIGRDVHSRPTYSLPVECPFATVNMSVSARKTSVRADSSASRGAADETMAERAKILLPAYVVISIGDKFEYDDLSFRVTTIHKRRSVLGTLDHLEIDLELIP